MMLSVAAPAGQAAPVTGFVSVASRQLSGPGLSTVRSRSLISGPPEPAGEGRSGQEVAILRIDVVRATAPSGVLVVLATVWEPATLKLCVIEVVVLLMSASPVAMRSNTRSPAAGYSWTLGNTGCRIKSSDQLESGSTWVRTGRP